ncbi:Mut7-C RNAse domain-containing protein [Desulfobacter postgatei]|uniref:Mut7-C RNAse domain-containing protein n=1 Tax=Desulfobacter postgatei TaxID=2293 RepID=UPI00259BCE6A|nr:Mut7-C RNAse domain-containing protein [uncultured Desulfobacter sp.]
MLIIEFEKSFDFFLSKKVSHGRALCPLDRKAGVKDIVESYGVPHTEIGSLVFNRRPVDFSFVCLTGGILSVGAVQPPFDVCSPSFLRPHPACAVRFIADVNVMRLGRLMILAGFDVCSSSSYEDAQIADIAEQESRIVLTRDTRLLMRKKITFARRIRAQEPYAQLMETLSFFGLKGALSFFTRCTRCNTLLQPVTKAAVLPLLEPKTRRYYNEFLQCLRCGQVYWPGSHRDHLLEKMRAVGLVTDKVEINGIKSDWK